MRTQVSLQVRNADGGSDTLWISVNVNLLDEAPLHVGEMEEFRIRAEVSYEETASGSHRVDVEIEPTSWYHAYPSYRRRSVTVWGSSSASVWFDFGHDGRIEGGAAPSFDNVAVNYGPTSQPWDLKFRDIGFEENGAAPTEYAFSVHRSKFFGKDKLVAQGIFPWSNEDLQRVRVFQDGPYREGAEEWFREGEKYLVRLRVRRQGSPWYNDEFGDRFSGSFTWDSGKQALVPLTAIERNRDPRKVIRRQNYRKQNP
jgi:hypothetical protein